MRRDTIDFGIDLGTTNSEIAVMDGPRPTLIKAEDDKEYIPSCVWIDPKDRLYVGQRAKDRLLEDPSNAFIEFKRDMGTTNKKHFERSGRDMSPEELSAEVLKTLKENVRQKLNGEVVENVVITVPAKFNLDQTAATTEAALLAGFHTCETLQEPIAAAIAYGFEKTVENDIWMVYDFGGGTFDVAIIQMKEGNFRVVNSGGDNELGGKDIDWQIIDSYIVPLIKNEFNLLDFERTNLDKYRSQFAKLKGETEKAKIRISSNETEEIFIDSLFKDKDFSCEITRNQVAEMSKPLILKSIEKAKQVISESGFQPSDIKRIILVGGPTKAPYLRDLLISPLTGLGIPIEYSVDPMTVVAQGAAIYAGGRPAKSEPKNTDSNTFLAEVNHKPIDADNEPIVGIKIVPPEGINLTGYKMEVKGNNWSSGRMPAEKGSILLTVPSEPGIKNIYQMILFNPEGTAVKLDPNQFSYIIGNASASQTLTQNFGVALADDSVLWYFKKGDPLPIRKTNILKTIETVKKGSSGGVISVPMVEGESSRAMNNKLVGVLRISSEKINRDVPIDSEIEVEISFNTSREIQTKAYIPILDEEFPQVITLGRSEINLEDLKADYQFQKKRYENLLENAQKTNSSSATEKLQKINSDDKFNRIAYKIEVGRHDPQELSNAQSKLSEIREEIQNIEAETEWPMRINSAEDQLESTQGLVDQFGNNTQKGQMSILNQEMKAAIENKDIDLLDRTMDEIHDLGFSVLTERPEFWVYWFEMLEKEDITKFNDQNYANRLLNNARSAINSGDLDTLRQSIVYLIQMLPREKQSKYSGISSVQK